MNYENAGDLLPEHLLKEIKKYAAGKLLYIPLDEEKKAWGEVSGYRHTLVRRNQFILDKFRHGVGIRELAMEFHLSEETVKRIVYSRKNPDRLDYQPTSQSATLYAEAGMLEEWLHTYLLFGRRNKAFSDGLRLAYRYLSGPLMMPLSLFTRSSGPEEHMKWQVSAGAFEHRVTAWLNQINASAKAPPLIVNFEHGLFELNCDNPLLEALNRANVQKYPIILWMTELTDYDLFRDEYAAFLQLC